MTGARDEAIQALMPFLIDVQRKLDGRLNLDRMAGRLGYSRYHFHRLFRSVVGETPRAHVERLRMERAAYKLWISPESVLDIALSVGFRSHETFSRAFKRHFGATPQAFRQDGRAARRQRIPQHGHWTPQDCVLSEVRYETLRGMPLLAIRYIGPYNEIREPGSTHDRHWRALLDGVRRKRAAHQPIAVAIFHDNPWLTPNEQQRADLCVPLALAGSDPGLTPGSRSIRCIQFAAGLYAAITHMGPLSTRPLAFRRLADAVHASDRYAFPNDGAVAISMTPLVGRAAAVQRTDVYVPVVRKV